MDANDKKVRALMEAEYKISIPGAMIGYILSLLADEQRMLDEVVSENITDINAIVIKTANDMVGNRVLHEVYRAAGAEFLALAMGVDEKFMDDLMSNKPMPMGGFSPGIPRPPRDKMN
jgi:hypothetical protein